MRRLDERFMREALRLAEKGIGHVHPNPMVGAVVVREGRIIARGYHHAVGQPHAEIEALRLAKENVKGATLFVNLEPCNHVGRTPPCIDAVIRAGISRVVCATRDPNPRAQGGIEKLRRAGIKVSVGTLQDAARDLNETFLAFHEKHRPFVALKFAASLDGKIATRSRDSKWITNEEARCFARRLRGNYQAILVGVETILADDPHLGTRAKDLPDPIRVILDSRLRIPMNAQVLRNQHVIIATTNRASVRKREMFLRRGIRVISFQGARISPKQLLAVLRKIHITSVLVEGGGAVLGSFIDAGTVDKVYAFYAPILIGGEKAVRIGGRGVRHVIDAKRFKTISVKQFGDTVLVTGMH